MPEPGLEKQLLGQWWLLLLVGSVGVAAAAAVGRQFVQMSAIQHAIAQHG